MKSTIEHLWYTSDVDRPYSFIRCDAGRARSKRPGQDYDCTVRALAKATDVSYDEAYDFLLAHGRRCSRKFDFSLFLRGVNYHALNCDFKWIFFQAVKGEKRMNTLKFTTVFNSGTYIAKTSKHVFAIIDGTVYDTEEVHPNKCIYGAWEVVRKK